MNPICFYHKADLDGVCSAAIVKHFVPDCELYGADYGELFPWALVAPTFVGDTMSCADIAAGKEITGSLRWPCSATGPRTVYMVDFSLPAEDMKRLAEVSDLVWIDHHKTAIEAVSAQHMPFFRGIGDFKHGLAACELAWLLLTRDSPRLVEYALELAPESINGGAYPPIPEAVRLLGTYDSWRKDDPEWDTKVLPFQYGMRAYNGVYDPTSGCWETLLSFEGTVSASGQPASIIDVGDAILRYQAEVNRRACEAGMYELCIHTWSPTEGYFAVPTSTREEDEKFKSDNPQSTWCRVLACNTHINNSQFFDGFFDPEKHDVMCAYAQMSDGRWKVSLYSTKPEIDCGAICKTFGGGGHRGAAGFMCDKLPWEKE